MTQAFDPSAVIDALRLSINGDLNGVTVNDALKNPAVARCVNLISFSMGYLPVHIRDKTTKEKATDFPIAKLLNQKPNAYQSPFNFKQFTVRNLLVHGNAYIFAIRSGDNITQLISLDPRKMSIKQNLDWSIEYKYSMGNGSRLLDPKNVVHLYADSNDGLTGLSMTQTAADAIETAKKAGDSARRMFTQGVMAGGALQTEQVLGPDARANIEESLKKKHEGVENQGKWMLLEQGLTAKPFGLNALDAQQVETLNHQIEEIGRAYGVPRPLLGMDETSWGSGISVLGQLFVRYTLNPLFVIFEQGIECFLFDDKERDLYEAKYNANALLRGNMTEQAEFFSKALGSGGHQPWMDYQEIRDASDLPAKEIAPNPLTKQKVPENVTPEST